MLKIFSGFIGKASGEALGSGNSGNVAALTAMEATEHNYLSHWQTAQMARELQHCKDWFCSAGIMAKWGYTSVKQDAAFVAGVAASIPATAIDNAKGIYHLATHLKESCET